MSDRFKVLSSDRRYQAWRNPDTYHPPRMPSPYPRQLGPRGIQGSDDPSHCISNNHEIVRFVKAINSDPAKKQQMFSDWEAAKRSIQKDKSGN